MKRQDVDGSARLIGEHSRAVQLLRSLGQARGRRDAGLFVIEGRKNVAAALDGGSAESLYLAQSFWRDGAGRELAGLAARRGVSCGIIADRVFRRLSDAVTPQGVLAVARLPERHGSLADYCRRWEFIAVLDGVQDAGNVGAMIRTGLAAGVEAMVLSEGCADPFSPKAVRGSAGAILRMPVRFPAARGEVVTALREKGAAVYGAVPRGGRPPGELRFSRPLAILVGGEGVGLSGELLELCTERVTIPMAGGLESLNAAVAFGVIVMAAAMTMRG